jgi:hypothetical protein
VVFFALGAGFDLVVALMAGVMTLVTANLAAPATWMAPAFIVGMLGSAGAICLGMIVLLFRRRTWWNKLGPRRQRGAAAAIFFLVGGSHLAIGITIAIVL